MPNKRRFTAAEDGEIAQSYLDGETTYDLASKYGTSRRAITNALLRENIQLRPRSVPRPEEKWAICSCGGKVLYASKGLCRKCYDEDRRADPRVQELRFTWKLKYCFNMSREEYDRILKEQDDRCAICRKPDPRGWKLAVDHDHDCCPGSRTCGSCNRGLLCVNCNTAVGSFSEDIGNLQRALEYLGRWKRLMAG